MTESRIDRKARAKKIVRGLAHAHPDAHCALNHENELQLLVATILSAQCTDQRVNIVTEPLFRKYRSAEEFANASPEVFEKEIHSAGFFRNKTKSLIGLGRALSEHHRGEVPDRMEALVELPGVGRKTANVILGTWFRQPAIPVDTHVTRLSNLLALTGKKDAVKIEMDLQKLLPKKEWTFASHALIWHGRLVCKARRPACDACGINHHCPSRR